MSGISKADKLRDALSDDGRGKLEYRRYIRNYRRKARARKAEISRVPEVSDGMGRAETESVPEL